MLRLQEKGEKSGYHSLFPPSNNDWFLLCKSPITELTNNVSADGGGNARTKPGDPPFKNYFFAVGTLFA